MAKRARCDPELMLRDGFKAEVEEERRRNPSASTRPRAQGAPVAAETPGTEGTARLRRAWISEAATAALLALTIEAAVLGPFRHSPVSRSIAESVLSSGAAVRLGEELSGLFAEAALAYGELARGEGGEATPSWPGRFDIKE
jgi:hypothetical protein